ncbi:hypothetical protein [Dinghuibacter silviterrae]|uniref:Uncharacterized protein n=1 Tax=Dinghuibacter silviterrae TaxID=1539049 RepID=A0A4R8DUT1_9BACT|nr:hypothetical protein [Dinghuibacter silviterrae]TDX01716.1 hypothetical protein EDB95_2758 [Dinghuibacter silviterrae]
MKYILPFVLFACLPFFPFAQAVSDSAHAQAARMAEAFSNENYTVLGQYTYPKIVKMMGGKDKMSAVIKAQRAQMQNNGVTITGVSVGTPTSIVKTNSGLQCVVPEYLDLKAPSGVIHSTTYLIGFSMDGGHHWTFLDASNKDLATIRKPFPEVSTQLTIPPSQ